jgi:Holliday junction resolvase RusA-like endonuclease
MAKPDPNIQTGVQIDKVPMPPSQNKQLMVSRGRMIKTKDARAFDMAFEVFMLTRKRALEATRDMAHGWLKEGFNALRVDVEFFFPKEKLFTKKKTIKRLDTTNRLKAVLDKISIALEIDDSLFVETFATRTLADKEYCKVTIYPMYFTEDVKK